MAFKIYTKRGDSGETSLYGGKRLPKDHIRIEAYGTVDELNASLGLLGDVVAPGSYQSILTNIQDKLFSIGANLASDPAKKMSVPQITEADVAVLEKAIDEMETALSPLKNFILPGGHPVVSHCHMARCICRRAERRVVTLDHESTVDPILIRYLNRLSDYLFVLSRKLAKDLGIEEKNWNAK